MVHFRKVAKRSRQRYAGREAHSIGAPSHLWCVAIRFQSLPDDRLEHLFQDTQDDLLDVPLVGGRGTYLHLQSNDCGLGVKWSPKDITLAPIDDELGLLFDPQTDKLISVR